MNKSSFGGHRKGLLERIALKILKKYIYENAEKLAMASTHINKVIYGYDDNDRMLGDIKKE